MVASDSRLDSDESVCSLTAEEFSDITGFAYDGSLMTSCYWSLQHDVERSTLDSVDRYRVYRPICLIPNGEVLINGYLSIFAEFSDTPTVSIYYEIYTHDKGEYVHKVHSRSYTAPASPDIVSYTSPDNWLFDYQIIPSTVSYTFSFQEEFNGKFDVFISKTLEAGTVETVKHKQTPWYHWQYI